MLIQGPHTGGTFDKIFTHVANGSGTAIARGDFVSWLGTATGDDLGYLVTAGGSGDTAYVGVAETVGPAASGTFYQTFLVQCYGVHDAAKTTATSGGFGAYLQPAASSALAVFTPGAGTSVTRAALQLSATTTATSRKVFVRCM